MSRVEINADGRHVVGDHNGDLAEASETAMKLWEHAESYRSPGPAVGFAATERRWSPQASAAARTTYDRGRPFAPVEAEVESS